MNTNYCRLGKKGELDCLFVQHPRFSAELLLQGAQLISFAPTQQDNWLWLSELAQYQQGQAVRGGIPICWPWFGNAERNPEAVKALITKPEQAPAHGFVRTQVWKIVEIIEQPETIQIELCTNTKAQIASSFQLALKAVFELTATSLKVQLITENTGKNQQSFSQALHSYFPTQDIKATQLLGLDDVCYLDTLANWQEKLQQQAVEFTAETDRIYYPKAAIYLHTPNYQAKLQSQGSQSAVVWNPWIEKSKTLSQFSAAAYLKMFCVETANAAADFVTLAPGAQHCLDMTLSR